MDVAQAQTFSFSPNTFGLDRACSAYARATFASSLASSTMTSDVHHTVRGVRQGAFVLYALYLTGVLFRLVERLDDRPKCESEG